MVLEKDGSPVNGLRIKIWTDGWEGAYSLVSGVGLTYSAGQWDLIMKAGQSGNFYLTVSDWQTGPDQFSPVDSEVLNLDFNYDTDSCQPEGDGHQWAEVEFIRNW